MTHSLEIPDLHDPVFSKDRKYSSTDRFFLEFIRDKRDLPFIYLTIKIILFMLPVSILLYMPFITGWVFWGLAVVYLVLNNLVYKGPFGLMLHCTSHRKWFRKKYDYMNKLLPWIVGPFFGQTPETYYSHHIGMHHPENNLPADRSTTIIYQRDSFGQWLLYFTRFFFVGIIELSAYFKEKNRTKLLFKSIRGELLFIFLCVALSFVDWQATLVVFILPYLFSRVVMMLGNWAQHTFVDPLDPGNPYKNSITCINVKYNHKCFNDGYHISHHEKPTLHWTEHPKHLLKNADRYAKNEAIIFDGLDYLAVFFYTLTGRYDKLAASMVDIGGNWDSEEEKINLLKKRTRKFTDSEMQALTAHV